MVLIGLIIIAVVLMALGGPGIQWKLPAAMPAAGSMPWHGQSGKNEHVGQGARGTAPCAWSTVSGMASSSRFGGGMGSRPRRAHSRLGGAAVVLPDNCLITDALEAVRRPSASGTRPVTDPAPEKPAADRPSGTGSPVTATWPGNMHSSRYRSDPGARVLLRGQSEFRGRPAAQNASHPPRQDSAVAVPRDDEECHFMVEGKALGNDVWRVVRAMLERGSREQPAHELGVAGPQVQCDIRSHLVSGQVLVAVMTSRCDLLPGISRLAASRYLAVWLVTFQLSPLAQPGATAGYRKPYYPDRLPALLRCSGVAAADVRRPAAPGLIASGDRLR